MNEDFSFFWPNRGKPFFVDPGGGVIELEVIDDIPYLLSGTTSRDIEYADIEGILDLCDHSNVLYPRWPTPAEKDGTHVKLAGRKDGNPWVALPGSGASSSSVGPPPPDAVPVADDGAGDPDSEATLAEEPPPLHPVAGGA